MSRRIDTHGCQSYGTTPYIEEIFVGRCWDYQYVYNDESCMVRDVKNCSELWQLFRSGFAYRDPCNVTGDLYKDFAEAAMHDVGVDKTMFWSGTYFAAHAYSALSQRLTTLEDTLTGYVAQQLIWCGQTDDPGINYMSCNERCYRSAEEAFWGVASTAFARQAKGEVFTLLNGSRPEGAFKNDSYFAKYELPNLDQGQVTMINIVVIHSLDTPATETCDTGSILDLKEIITQYGFRYTCTDDPK
uniref:ADP-ribosyl cyclase-like n=1 Tax=Saccoglossus kowalevskii TaxID=10224 RepID=A0ABM0GRS1_SACKO|nr:PREDICTED: ADP-ribosyl cyclase-like [Saccoglossus kowalevskii]